MDDAGNTQRTFRYTVVSRTFTTSRVRVHLMLLRGVVVASTLMLLPSTVGFLVASSSLSRRHALPGSTRPSLSSSGMMAGATRRMAMTMAASSTAACEGAPMIEVERKYAASAPEDLRTRVLAAGGKELGEGTTSTTLKFC